MWHFTKLTNISTNALTIAEPPIASNVASVSEINEDATQSTNSVDEIGRGKKETSRYPRRTRK